MQLQLHGLGVGYKWWVLTKWKKTDPSGASIKDVPQLVPWSRNRQRRGECERKVRVIQALQPGKSSGSVREARSRDRIHILGDLSSPITPITSINRADGGSNKHWTGFCVRKEALNGLQAHKFYVTLRGGLERWTRTVLEHFLLACIRHDPLSKLRNILPRKRCGEYSVAPDNVTIVFYSHCIRSNKWAMENYTRMIKMGLCNNHECVSIFIYICR